MRIWNYNFSPKWVPSIATLILLPVLLSLGVWQLNRAEEKRQIVHMQTQRMQLPAYPLKEIPADVKELEYRRIVVTGRYLNEKAIYIDNKVVQGQVGYNVVLPLLLADQNMIVLVNRGWLGATESRSHLPEFTHTEGRVSVTGVVKLETKDIFSFSKQNRLGDSWPALVRWIEPGDFEKSLQHPVAKFLLLQDPEPADQFKRVWTFINSSPEKSTSYAMQWFSLAALLLLIYVFVNTKRIK